MKVKIPKCKGRPAARLGDKCYKEHVKCRAAIPCFLQLVPSNIVFTVFCGMSRQACIFSDK
jgi:hypothetical protein